MHNIVLIEYLEGFYELFEDKESLSFRDDAIFAKHALKSASIAVLVNKVEVVGRFEHIDILDYMLILLDVSQDIDFVDGTLL